MKFYEIEQISNFLNQFKTINSIVRIDLNILKITFDKTYIFFFNMTRNRSFIFKKNIDKSFQFNKYSSPFDILLKKYVSFSQVISIKTLNQDRVMEFQLSSKNSYKIVKFSIQFEFTGKYTNVIILDENRNILEALRHIDELNSFRVVKPNIKLIELPVSEFKHQIFKKIENIDNYLLKIYEDEYENNLSQLKVNKLKIIDLKISKLEKILLSLEDEKTLKNKSILNTNYANQILINLHKIKKYDKYLIFKDENSVDIKINFPKNILVNRLSDYFFKLSKQNIKKSKSIFIERENITDKIKFYQNLNFTIKKSTSMEEINIIIPSKKIVKKNRDKNGSFQVCWINKHKILIGRNKKENQKLIEQAKANDIWMHIKDVPSSHLIIKCDKQDVAQNIIEESGKLLLKFFTKNSGKYEIDYTKRKFVKLQDGSNVFYSKSKRIICIN